MVIDILKSEFLKRKCTNRQYSLRAFAQQLEIPPGRLSEYISGKRGITTKAQNKILEKLNLKSLFESNISGLSFLPNVEPETKRLENETFHVIADWIHFAILSLMDTKDFKSDPAWIATRFGVSVLEVRLAIEKLESVGLVKKDRNHYKKQKANLKTNSDMENLALKQSHAKTLRQAETVLYDVAVEFRDISSVTFAMDMKKLSLAKSLIKQFRRKLCTLMETSESSEVYNLNIQLLPITKTKKGKL